MTRPTRTGNPAGDALLRPFRFQELEVGAAESTTAAQVRGGGGCDVLLALDFDGTSSLTLDATLAAAKQRIRDGGVLLLGLSNRFGLRFWSGSPEPGSGTLFTTLAGRGTPPNARAVSAPLFASRRELSQALTRAGFAVLEWFLAAPDPNASGESGTLVSERLIAAAPELAAELAALHPSADRRFPRLDLLPEALVARELARCGLLAELANHFLVAASPAPLSAGSTTWSRLRPPAQEVAWHHAPGRRVPIATVFELEAGGAGRILVSKRRLDDGELPDSDEFSWVPQARSPLAPGESLRLRLEEHLIAGRSGAFLEELSTFFDFVRARFGRASDLEGEALDALASNATLDESGSFHLFDLEWQARSRVPVSWWILRNVIACLEMRGKPIADLPHCGALYEALCARAGVEPCLAADLAREADLGAAVRARSPGMETRELATALARPWPVTVALGLAAGDLGGGGADLASEHQRLIAAYRKLESWALDLQAAAVNFEEARRRLETRVQELEIALQERDPESKP